MSKSTVLRGIFAVLAISVAAPVVAQESDTAIFEEILVTATKREQTLQEIPVAVSVVGAQTIRDSVVYDIRDLQFLVPSLRVSQLQTSGNTNFIIRGFGNGANNAGVEPSVGVFIDGVYRSRSAGALNDLPNLERVEVLRGPQSTLFGKNASAGVVNVVTAPASLDGVEGMAEVSFGEYDQIVVKGDVSGPVTENLALGIAASYQERDGYFDNLQNGNTLNNRNRATARGELYFEPSSTFDLRVIADWDSLDEDCCGVANLEWGPAGGAISLVSLPDPAVIPNEPFAYANYADFDPINEIENAGLSAQFDWEFSEAATLTSITAYRTQDRFENVDIDFTGAALLAPEGGNLTDTTIDTLTQEFRLQGSTDTIDWMVGLFYFDEEVSSDQAIIFGPEMRPYVDLLAPAPAIPGVPLPPGASLFDALEALGNLQLLPSVPQGSNFYGNGDGNVGQTGMDNQAISLFTQFDFHLGDSVTITLGANYTEDEKDAYVNYIGTEEFSALELDQVGAEFLFLQQVGLPAIPPVIAMFPVEWGTSQLLGGVTCPNTTPGFPPDACNPLLDLIPFQFLPPVQPIPNSVESNSTKDDQTTWAASIAFDVNDYINLYARAATGFKASSWNLFQDSKPTAPDAAALETAGELVPNLTPGTRFAGPEDSTVYEIGLKSGWSNGALNLTVFTQEIEGFQSNVFIGTAFNLANAGTQSTDGVELEFNWVPLDFLTLRFDATWLDPLYDDFQTAACVGEICDLSGTKPAGIPELSTVTTVQFDFMVGSSTEAFFRLEHIFEDEVQVIENVPVTLTRFLPPNETAKIGAREVNTLNVSAGLRWANGFEAMLWGRNVTDDEYLQSAFPSVAQPGSFSGYPNQPATYGLTLRKFFD